MTTIYAAHDVDRSSEHYAHVVSFMREHGAPEIRAWWDDASGAWLAVEGSHRIAAATELGLMPVIVDVGESDEERAAALRASDIDEGNLFGRRDDDDADVVAWWSSYSRVRDAVAYEWSE